MTHSIDLYPALSLLETFTGNAMLHSILFSVLYGAVNNDPRYGVFLGCFLSLKFLFSTIKY